MERHASRNPASAKRACDASRPYNHGNLSKGSPPTKERTMNSPILLAVNIRNDETDIGIFVQNAPGSDPELAGSCTYTTPQHITCDEARDQIERACKRAGQPLDAIAGAIMSCVAPHLDYAWRKALTELSPARTLTMGPGLKSGIPIRYKNPREVGADRIAAAVGALAVYGAPCVVVNLGATTTFEVIDRNGAFLGGVIAPGTGLSAQSLAHEAAQLPVVDLFVPKRVIGQTTHDAIRSGIVLGEALRIDGLLTAIMDELGYETPVVLTGPDAGKLVWALDHHSTVDETLVLRGLAHIWALNTANMVE